MYDLTGYMTISGKDAWTEYSAFLCEDKPEDGTNTVSYTHLDVYKRQEYGGYRWQ